MYFLHLMILAKADNENNNNNNNDNHDDDETVVARFIILGKSVRFHDLL